jgi:hypothetical protein
MFGRGKSGKVYKQSLLVKAVIRFCLLFLCVFFFSAAQYTAAANTAKPAKVSIKDAVRHSATAFFQSADYASKKSSRSKSTPEEPKKSRESEQENSCDDDDNRLLLWIFSSAYSACVSSFVKIHYFQLVQSFQNQATLPLYVLFHSWKSYLI